MIFWLQLVPKGTPSVQWQVQGLRVLQVYIIVYYYISYLTVCLCVSDITFGDLGPEREVKTEELFFVKCALNSSIPSAENAIYQWFDPNENEITGTSPSYVPSRFLSSFFMLCLLHIVVIFARVHFLSVPILFCVTHNLKEKVLEWWNFL